MDTGVTSSTPNLTTSGSSQINFVEDQLTGNSHNMSSFNHFENQIQMISIPVVYSNQVIIMEETNLFLVNQLTNDPQLFANYNKLTNPTELFDEVIPIQKNNQDYEYEFQDRYQGYEYVVQPDMISQADQVSEVEGFVELPTVGDIPLEELHLETYLNSNISYLQAMTQCSRNIFECPTDAVKLQPQLQPQTSNFRYKYDDESCSKSATPRQKPVLKVSSDSGEYGVYYRKKPQLKLPMVCPVKSCHLHLTKFYHSTPLIKHCFLTHVLSGKLHSKKSQQEKVLLSKILPECKDCERFFSRKDSLKRHIRQKHA